MVDETSADAMPVIHGVYLLLHVRVGPLRWTSTGKRVAGGDTAPVRFGVQDSVTANRKSREKAL